MFSRIRIEYGDIRSISPYSVRMRQNTDQNNSKYGHFSRSAMLFFNRLLTRPKVHYGQTLHISSDSGTDAARISVQAWYNQIIYFDFQKPRITGQNSYFIQLVWRSTREVGVGTYESSSGKTNVVAFYSPPGNTDNGLKFNVLPITSKLLSFHSNFYFELRFIFLRYGKAYLERIQNSTTEFIR